MADDREPEVRYYRVPICDACIRGEGEMCHTPACALIRTELPNIQVVYLEGLSMGAKAMLVKHDLIEGKPWRTK